MSSQKKTARKRPTAPPREAAVNLSHLRRETRTALELAVVALAPSQLTDHLATVAGLLEALAELPSNSPPALALTPSLVQRGREALSEWQAWQQANLARKMPRG